MPKTAAEPRGCEFGGNGLSEGGGVTCLRDVVFKMSVPK